MKLYHGSCVGGIEYLEPRGYEGKTPLVYLTDNEVLAAIYAHNPLPPPNGWFSYRFSSDGLLHYDEYFKSQLTEIYSGKRGFVYTIAADDLNFELKQHDKMRWVYTSEKPVLVSSCREVPDILSELLKCESEGKLKVHRYETIPKRVLKSIDNDMLAEIENNDLRSKPDDPYFKYIVEHFPHLFS